MAIPGTGAILGQQLGYQQAWNEANRQLAAQQASLQSQYGFNGQGQFMGDPTSIFGAQNDAWGQQLGTADSAIRSRGFDPSQGFGQQLEYPVRQTEGAQAANLYSKYTGALGKIADVRATDYAKYQTGLVNALLSAANSDVKGRAFTPASIPKSLTTGGKTFAHRAALIRYLNQHKIGYGAWSAKHPVNADIATLLPY